MTLPFVPTPPHWQVPWPELDAHFTWVAALRGCPQDPIHHAEGDVWIHTRMVLEALSGLAEFRALEETSRARVFWACLLHDIAKPATTRLENGRIGAPGHSARGALLARQVLWELEVPPGEREAICAMVRSHQVPFFLIERPEAARIARVSSLLLHWSELCLVTEADARGRECADRQRLIDAVDLTRMFCEDHGVLTAAYPFPSASARVAYAAGDQADPSYAPYDQFRCEVTILSGLPGAGKDTWAARHAADRPMVSLDALREQLGIGPEQPQGAVIQAGREAMRRHLRAGESFVYNATNLSRSIRNRAIGLARDYGAWVRIVHIEAPRATLLARNRARARCVPPEVIERLLSRWEVPDISEAHEVLHVTAEATDHGEAETSRLRQGRESGHR